MPKDRLIKDLIHAYHASNRGRRPFNPKELTNLEELLNEKLVEVTVCNEDERSGHEAYTCRVKLCWLLPDGIKEVENYFNEYIDKLVDRVVEHLNSFNPRVRSIVKYLSTINIWPDTDYIKFYFSKHSDVKYSLRRLLPDYLFDYRDKFLEFLVELGLISRASVEHTVSGWKEKVYVCADEIQPYLRKIRRVSLPLLLDLVLAAYGNIKAEHLLIRFQLVVAKKFDFNSFLIERSNYFTFPERVIYQLSKTEIPYSPPIVADWEKVYRLIDRMYSSYYIDMKLKERADELIKLASAHFPSPIVEAAEERMNKTEELLKKLIEEWLKKGEICGVEIDDLSFHNFI